MAGDSAAELCPGGVGQEYVWLDGRPRQLKTILAALPEEGWTRLSAGDGTKGPRWYDWRWQPLAEPVDRDWRRWLLVRRSLSTPTERTAYVVFARQDTTLEEGVRVAGTRWTIESGFEAAKVKWGWIIMRSAAGRDGIGISPSPCGPWPC